MPRQLDILEPQSLDETWHVKCGGAEYEIKKDCREDRLAPSWYVQRMNDLRYSKRYYSQPSGAFAAIVGQRVVWE
jgi:hypothetical protein